MASYGDVANTYLLQLAGADSAVVAAALNSADEEIDEAFASGGYATPIPLSSIANATAAARLTAKLNTVSNAISGFLLSTPTNGTGKKGSPEKVAKDCTDARAWLARIAKGELIIQSLVDAGGLTAGVTGLSVVGSHVWLADDTFFDLAHLPLD